MRNPAFLFLIFIGACFAVAWKSNDVKPPPPIRIEGHVTEVIYACDDSTADFTRPGRQRVIYIKKQIGNGPIVKFKTAITDSVGNFSYYIPANSGPATYYFYEMWKGMPYSPNDNTFCYSWDNECLKEIHGMPDYVLLHEPKEKYFVPITLYKNCEGLSVCCTIIARTTTLTE